MSEPYRVVIASSAQREIKKLPLKEISRVLPAIEQLTNDPRPPGCKKLVGSKNYYRIRVGNYRILYLVEDTIKVVEVSGVRHRREAYE